MEKFLWRIWEIFQSDLKVFCQTVPLFYQIAARFDLTVFYQIGPDQTILSQISAIFAIFVISAISAISVISVFSVIFGTSAISQI